jgi:hypothetical protein|tara:strand:+ start:165 stop:470 length:306 start_codon:yes stop_codon:yes gene_type:complete
MSELLKALQSMAPPKPKVHTVCIAGQNVVVTLAKKLEVLKHGEEAYHWISATEFALKPPPKPKTEYSVLQKAKKGYAFEQDDIHWPNNIIEGGETWLIEKE